MTRARIEHFRWTACCVATVLIGAGWTCETSVSEGSLIGPEAPTELIAGKASCASASPARASRLEWEGRMRAERYPYDPRDGVLGAVLFLEASQCYHALGSATAARRASASAGRLVSRISADYAAARVALEHALEEGSWSGARENVQRLLALTEHLQPHPYVEWLLGIAALAASRDEPSL